MIPSNGTAVFRIRSTVLTERGVCVEDDEVTVTERACLSRPKRWVTDPSINDMDQTREWANLRLDRFPDEFKDAGDIKLDWMPDGYGASEEWSVNRVHQPVSVAGYPVSCKLTISRRNVGVGVR